MAATFLRTFAGAAVAALTLCGAVLPSQAAVYRGAWDPAYGTPFPDLGWRGEIEVSAPDSCIADGVVTNLAGGCNGAMQIISAKVELYNIATPGTVLDTLDFGSAAYVGAMRFSGSDLTGLLTSPFQAQQSSVDPVEAQFGGASPYFSLIFLDNVAQLYWFKDDPGSFLLNPLVAPYVDWPDAFNYAYCARVSDGSGGFNNPSCGWASDVDGNLGPLLRFSTVPEASSLALVPLALCALGLARRRRRPAD